MSVGFCYENGTGVEKNPKLAFEYYSKAANAGLSLGQYYLGRCYYHGKGTTKDYAKAVELFRKSIQSESRLCRGLGYFSLGLCCLTGKGVEKNREEAFRCFRNAADSYHNEAQLLTGVMYLRGIGTQADPAEAFRQLSLVRRSPAADYLVGMCYFQGTGTAKNAKLAFQSFRKAADGGSADAMNMLALCYRKGIGTSPNPDKSEFWKKHAARSGRKFSLVHLTE